MQDLRRVGSHPDFWYPVARSREIAPGGTFAARFAGEPIALVREQTGELHALEDRCAHRQVPLHKGAVCGNLLRCGYHGWAYDFAGKCVDVPYLEKDRSRPNGVRAYPCREAYGLAFVFPGDPAKAAAAPFPSHPAYSDPAYKTRTLDRPVRCHYSFMHENLMDMNHQFLHRSLMGGIAATLLGYEQGPGFLEARYTFSRTAGKQGLGERFMIGERLATPKKDQDTMTIRTQYPYQTLTFRRSGSDTSALDLWLAYVPLDRDQRVNRTLGLMSIRRPGVPGLIEVFWPFIVRFTDGIFAQDREIVELEQQAYDAQGADRNREIFPVINGLRDVLRSGGIPLQ